MIFKLEGQFGVNLRTSRKIFDGRKYFNTAAIVHLTNTIPTIPEHFEAKFGQSIALLPDCIWSY